MMESGESSCAAVTVVIPVYNGESFLGEAIQSVLSQSHARLRLLVIDDGSTDGSAEVAASFDDDRLTVISGPNRGVTRARNAGLRMAGGDMVAFLDADDYWLPTKLECQLSVLASRPELLAVGCLMRYESAVGRILGVSGQTLSSGDRAQIATGRLMPFPLSSVLFRREPLVLLDGFDEGLDAGGRVQAEDLELLARLAATGEVACLPTILGAYRVHGDSVSAREFEAQRTATRFIRARLAARARGSDLTWEEFQRRYRPTFRQRYGDRVQALYRTAGARAGEGRWGVAIGCAGLALAMNPRYTLGRILRQQRRRLVPSLPRGGGDAMPPRPGIRIGRGAER